MANIANISVLLGANTTGFQRGMSNAQRQLTTFSRNANSSLAVVKKALTAVAVTATVAFGAFATSATKSAMQFEASMQQIQRLLGSNAGEFSKWASEQARAFNLSRKEATQYGAVFANLVSQIAKDTAETEKFTQDLLRASAVVASGTGRDIVDVMERIRSGLLGNTESIEDLGINVNVAMLESTKAFKRFAGDKSWNQLSFQTQQQIRLFAILEQSAIKYGTEINKNTSSSLAQFSAILADVKLNIGQAFLPILNIAIPILVKFANILLTTSNAIKQFSQALFGQQKEQQQLINTTNNLAKAQSNAGVALKKAGDKAKGSIAGFDELNQLQQNLIANAETIATGADGEIATGIEVKDVGDMGNVGDSKMQENVNKFKKRIDELTDSFKKLYNVLGVTTMLNSLGNSIKTLGNIMGNFININWKIFKESFLDFKNDKNFTTLISNINKSFASLGTAVTTTVDGISKELNILSTAIDNNKTSIKTALTDMMSGFSIFGSSVILILSNIVKDGVDVFDKAIINNSGTISNILNTSIKIATGVLSAIGETFKQMGLTFMKVYKDNIGPLKTLIGGVMNSIADVINSLVINVINPIFLPAITSMKDIVKETFPKIRDHISDAIGDVIAILDVMYEDYLKPTFEYISDDILPKVKPVMAEIGKIFKDVFESSAKLVEKLFKALAGLTKFLLGVFTDDWSKAWDGLKEIFKSMWESLVDIARIPLNTIIRGINEYFIKKINAISIEIPEVNIPGIGTFGGGTIGFPKIPTISEIPALAEGGITTKPTLALIGDNMSGREAVLPLDNQSALAEIANAIIGAMQFGQNTTNNNNTETTAVLNIDGHEFARAIIPIIDNERNRIGKKAILNTV